MVLQVNRQWLWPLRLSSPRLIAQLPVAVNRFTVMKYRQSRIGRFLARGIPLRRGELNVVSLPGQRRETHVHIGLLLPIKSTALIMHSLQPEGI